MGLEVVAFGLMTHTVKTGSAGPIVGLVVVGCVAVFGVGYWLVRLSRRRGGVG